MLESMVQNPRPTRAEASDVANAIFDCTDVIMLSGETAKGAYPVEAVRTMATIASKAESTIDYAKRMNDEQRTVKRSVNTAINYATCSTANDLGASCIITVTKSGYTARMVAAFRPKSPILACALEPTVLRQLNLVWGCVPTLIASVNSVTDDVFEQATEKAVDLGMAKTGDSVVLTAGVPVGVTGTTNTLKVHIVGDVLVISTGVGNKTVSGKSVVIKVAAEAEKYFKKGDILVTHATNKDFLPYIKKAAALVVEAGEANSHAETVGKALDIPVIIAAHGASDIIKNGTLITVDSKKGFVYNGIPQEKK
jgi:pyruvate kinase